MEPAFIYESKAGGKASSFLPVVSPMISPEGRCVRASKRWCDSVRQQGRGPRIPWSSAEVQSALRGALAVAAEAGRDQVTLEDIERAAKGAGVPGLRPGRHRPLRFGRDVVGVLDGARKLADAAGAEGVGIGHVLEAGARPREGGTE